MLTSGSLTRVYFRQNVLMPCHFLRMICAFLHKYLRVTLYVHVAFED